MLPVLDYFQLAFNLLASVLNIAAVPVIALIQTPRLGSYKYFILIYTISAAVYTTSQALTLGSWHVPPNGYLYFCSATFLPRWGQVFCIYVFIGTFCINLSIICWCFAYRLTVMSGHQFAKYKLRIFLASLVTVFLWSICMITTVTIYPYEETDDFYRELLWNLTHNDLADQGYIGAPFSTDGIPNYPLYGCLATFAIYTSLAVSFILYCWLRIRRKLREIKATRYTAHLIHYHIYILLTIQTLFPLVFNAVPAICAFMLSMFHIPWQDMIQICGSFISVAQIVDPISTVVLITEYREAILQWIGKRPAQINDLTSGNELNGSK